MKRGSGQVSKGKVFERKIAAMLRARWPTATVRRASQAERAYNPDVFVQSGPRLLVRLWLELQDSAKPTPSKKLAQARRDVAASGRIPVAVTHKLGSTGTTATMALHDLCQMLAPSKIALASRFEVTMDLDAFIDLVYERAIAQDADAGMRVA